MTGQAQRAWLLPSALAAAAMLFGGWASLRWSAASDRWARAAASEASCAVECAKLAALRKRVSSTTLAPRAPNDLAQRIHAALGRAGASHCTFDVSASGDGVAAGGAGQERRVQRASVTLRGLRLDQAGNFLQAIRERAGPWEVDSIEFRTASSSGEDARGAKFDLVVGCSATYDPGSPVGPAIRGPGVGTVR